MMGTSKRGVCEGSLLRSVFEHLQGIELYRSLPTHGGLNSVAQFCGPNLCLDHKRSHLFALEIWHRIFIFPKLLRVPKLSRDPCTFALSIRVRSLVIGLSVSRSQLSSDSDFGVYITGT